MDKKHIKTIDNIRKLIYDKEVDWEKIESYVKELKPCINEEYDDGCILSYFINGFYYGKNLLKLVKVFMDNGFDVHKNDGKNGAMCLHELCWSTYDEYTLQIAEVLLDAGADSTINIYDEDEDEESGGILDSIGWKLAEWTVGSCECANMFEAYYKMIERHQNGKDYHGIRAFRDAVGMEITKVEKIAIEDSMSGENMFEGLIFWSHEIPIVANKNPEIYIYPQILEEARERIDVSVEFSTIIGRKVKGLQFTSATFARLKFDNDITVILCNNYLMNKDKKRVARYKITNGNEKIKLKFGDGIKCIYFREGYSYADSVRKYDIRNCFIQMEQGDIYHVYPKATHHHANLRFEKFDFNMCENLRKKLKQDNYVISHIEKNGSAYSWMELECEGKYIYLVPDGTWEGGMELYLMISKNKIEDPKRYGVDERKLEPMECEYREIKN